MLRLILGLSVAVGPLQATGFVDAGNVFPKASDLDFTDIRPTAGFGVMYRSPVGPIRVDLGFNLNPRELVPGVQERSRVLHILLGQPFARLKVSSVVQVHPARFRKQS